MRCQDVMKRPVVDCKETETLKAAARRMRDANIGFLPVCSEDGKAIGVLTDRDVTLRAVAEGLDTETTVIGRIMTTPAISCRRDHDLHYAEQLMMKNHKSRVLVVDEAGKPIGVISLSDVARHDRVFAAETMRQISSREIKTA